MRAMLRSLAALALIVSGSVSAQSPAWPPVGEATGARIVGRWLWADLVTSDVARSSEFYAKVFGWTFRNVPGAEGAPGYVTILANGRPIGGIVPKPPGVSGARWIELASGDPQAAAKRAEQLGGTIVAAPRMLPGRGELVVLGDPTGARFAVLRADGGDPPDQTGLEGEWMWTELWTPDPERAVEFYRGVLGYSVVSDSKGKDAFVLTADGRARAGVMRSPDASLPAAWIPYVRVSDVAKTVARAQEAGARVIVAPRPHHKSQVAVLVDPLGAPFAVAQWRAK